MTTSAPIMFLLMTAMPGLAGVAIGTPVSTTVPGLHQSLDVLSAEAPVDKMLLTDQQGDQHVHPIEQTIDLLDDSTIDMPPGTWDHATLVLDGPIRVNGQTPAGTFDLEIDVGAIFLTLPDPVSTEPESPQTTLHLGDLGWLTADTLNVPPSGHLFVDATHPLHDELRHSFRFDSTWE
ncbi:MAG: hypothetical protein AAF211_02350 [Myxococcota bacterium]